MTKFGALTRIKFLIYAFNGRFVAQITASALVGKQLLQARRNDKDLKVKPATSFKYFQYLLTKN